MRSAKNPFRDANMLPLLAGPPFPGNPRRVLAIGAHCDDIEIGAGGTLSSWAAQDPSVEFRFLVLTSTPAREVETRSCLAELVRPCAPEILVHALPDSRLPAHFDQVKEILGQQARLPWDLVLTHHRFDAHQDHRLLGELAATAFRDHLILQFEVPKWDGDLGRSRPNLYVPLSGAQVAAKWAALDRHYVSQRGKDWWDEETFAALSRLRGMECRATYAEAFRVDKLVLAPLDPPSAVRTGRDAT